MGSTKVIMVKENEKIKRVSIIMPVYNSQKTVKLAIESVLNQDYAIHEFIVIDDGSSDGSSEIINKYPVRLIKKQRGGEASALNVGIKACTGEYVGIVESDVILPKNWISELLKEFRDEKVYGVGATLEGVETENLIAKLAGYELEYRYEGIRNKFVSHITSANTLYRKKVFGEAGFYRENLFNGALDGDLNIRVLNLGKKLVLLKSIKVKHFWKTNLPAFLKRQFSYAFYRPYLGKNPLYGTDKIVAVQLVLTGLLVILVSINFFYNHFMLQIALIIFLVLLMQTPLIISAMRRKRGLYVLLFLPVNLLRNVMFLIGYSLGFIHKYFSKNYNA